MPLHRPSLRTRRRVLSELASAGLAAVLPLGAHAQAFPARPIRLIVPNPAGGPTDLTARLIAEKLGASLGQPVVVDNRAGAAGLIGAQAVVQAPADGYTLGILGSGQVTLLPAMRKDPPYDPLRSFTPVAYTVHVPNVVAVHPSLNVRSMAELVALVRANPGKFSYGSDGASTHMLFELIKLQAGGLDVVHVPYKGSAEMVADLLRGSVQMSISGIASPLAHHEAGSLRIVAATSSTRPPALPDVPTLKEQGVDVDVVAWFGAYAPAGTPAPVLAMLEDHVLRAMRQPDVAAKLQAAGLVPAPAGARELARTTERYANLYQSIMKRVGIQPE